MDFGNGGMGMDMRGSKEVIQQQCNVSDYSTL